MENTFNKKEQCHMCKKNLMLEKEFFYDHITEYLSCNNCEEILNNIYGAIAKNDDVEFKKIEDVTKQMSIEEFENKINEIEEVEEQSNVTLADDPEAMKQFIRQYKKARIDYDLDPNEEIPEDLMLEIKKLKVVKYSKENVFENVKKKSDVIVK